jgi:P27 family predicted phage terminase small subunit
MAGRKPIPTRIKIATGNPGRTAINRDEPAPKASRLKVPEHVRRDKVAAAAYRALGKQLLDAGVMSVLDEIALAEYAVAYSGLLSERAKLLTEGSVLTNAKGASYTNPRVWIVQDHRNTLSKLLIEFGMTPSSRSRLKTVVTKTDGGKGTLESVLGNVSAETAEARAWEPPVDPPQAGAAG